MELHKRYYAECYIFEIQNSFEANESYYTYH